MAKKSFDPYPLPELEAAGYGYDLPNSQAGLDLNLEQYLIKLKRRWKPASIAFLATLGTTVALSLMLTETFTATGKLLFRQDTAGDLTGIGENNVQIGALQINETPLNNELEKIQATPVLNQTIEELQLTNDEGDLLSAKDFARSLKVEIVGGSDIIEISYESEDPEQAEAVVNSLMSVYLQQQIRSRQADPASAKEFINQQLPAIENKVKAAEEALEEFRTENNVVDLQEEKRTIVQEIGTTNRDISTLGASFQGKKAQTTALQNQLGLSLDQAIAVDKLSNTPAVRSTLSELANTESALAQARQVFKDTHPEVASLKEKRANLRQNLQSTISRSVGQGVRVPDGLLHRGDINQPRILDNFIALKIEELSLGQQLNSVSRSRDNYLQRAQELPRLEKQEQELLRRAQTANTTYQNLLDSLAEVDLAENQETGNIEIIEPAVVPEEGSTGRLPIIALGFISGLLLANVTAVALEWRDRTIKSIAEIKQKLPYKMLGAIPQVEELQQGVQVVQEPDSYLSELYRMLQANLKFMGNQQRPPKVILVTSSVPGEGKSTVTANLAAAISQLGNKVLLIDGDLRKPTQQNLWQIGEMAGLQEMVKEQKPLASAVYQPVSKLDLLLSGQRLANPLAVLDSLEMSELIAKGRKNYDLVIIDAPPLPVTADVLTLSKLVDGILFVTRMGVVEQESADLALETLGSIDTPVLGMVVNGVKTKEFEKYSYSSRYGKRYFQDKVSKDEYKSKTAKGKASSTDSSYPQSTEESQDLGLSG